MATEDIKILKESGPTAIHYAKNNIRFPGFRKLGDCDTTVDMDQDPEVFMMLEPFLIIRIGDFRQVVSKKNPSTSARRLQTIFKAAIQFYVYCLPEGLRTIRTTPLTDLPSEHFESIKTILVDFDSYFKRFSAANFKRCIIVFTDLVQGHMELKHAARVFQESPAITSIYIQAWEACKTFKAIMWYITPSPSDSITAVPQTASGHQPTGDLLANHRHTEQPTSASPVLPPTTTQKNVGISRSPPAARQSTPPVLGKHGRAQPDPHGTNESGQASSAEPAKKKHRAPWTQCEPFGAKKFIELAEAEQQQLADSWHHMTASATHAHIIREVLSLRDRVLNFEKEKEEALAEQRRQLAPGLVTMNMTPRVQKRVNQLFFPTCNGHKSKDFAEQRQKTYPGMITINMMPRVQEKVNQLFSPAYNRHKSKDFAEQRQKTRPGLITIKMPPWVLEKVKPSGPSCNGTESKPALVTNLVYRPLTSRPSAPSGRSSKTPSSRSGEQSIEEWMAGVDEETRRRGVQPLPASIKAKDEPTGADHIPSTGAIDPHRSPSPKGKGKEKAIARLKSPAKKSKERPRTRGARKASKWDDSDVPTESSYCGSIHA
jgi:hypothetical protein